MFKRTVTEDDLGRLKGERGDADRVYNDALTAADRALPGLPEFPSPPPPFDEQQVAPLNELRTVVPGDPSASLSGWRKRLAEFVWHLVGPVFGRQQEFNAALVDHINRNTVGHRETRAALETTIALLRGQLEVLAAFHSSLIVYFQQLTPYVDTKDREVAALMRRINEDVAAFADLLDHRTVGLSAGLNGLSDELLKRSESMVAHEQRYEMRVSALATANNQATVEFQTRLAALQQTSGVLRRELERLSASAAPAAATAAAAGPCETPAATPAPGAPPAHASALQEPGISAALDSSKYVGFEDIFRGLQEDIRQRLAEYLPYFAGASDVLDLGCGRGEFLDLLREKGVSARGVDINHEMVEACRSRGLEVADGDGLAYLGGLARESIGGLFAAQVVEHLQPDSLVRLLEVAYDKLRPSSRIIVETINPTSWAAFFDSYIRDLSHVRPLHPDTLKYLLQATGFEQVEIRYRAPYPERAKLQPVVLPRVEDDAPADLRRLADFGETFNANVARINGLLFTYMDYAVIGTRG